MCFRNPLFICANYDPLLLSFLVPVAFCRRLTSKTTEWCVRCDSYGKITAMVEEGFSFMVSVSFNAECHLLPIEMMGKLGASFAKWDHTQPCAELCILL